MKVYEMKIVVAYSINVLAESEAEAKYAADRYFDDQGLYEDIPADSECVEEFDWPEDVSGEIIVPRGDGYDYWDDVKEEE